MRLDNLSDWQRADVERRIAKGYGEVINISYLDLVEKTVPVVDGEGNETGAELRLVPVPAEVQVYVGKLSPGQTGTVINVLGRVFFQGLKEDKKEEKEAKAEEKAEEKFDLNAIIGGLDDDTMTLFFSTITGLDEEFVYENWDIEWVADVFAAFIRHNDFFKVLEKVTNIAVSITGAVSPSKPTLQRVK